MKQILKQDGRSIITRDGDKVIKTFVSPRPEFKKYNWLTHYDAFYNMYGGIVRVYDANQNRIVMDYVDGILFDEHFWTNNNRDHELTYKLFSTILKNLSNMAEYSSNLNNVWFHDDAGTHNYMMRDNGEFVLIDPESFTMKKNPYPGGFVSSLYPLQNILRALFVMHEEDYNKHVN